MNEFTPEQEIIVKNNTMDLYRFFDATMQVEYLYDRIADTIRVDFKDELDFLVGYDRALSAIGRVIDMPNRKAALLATLCLQNDGRLSSKKRSLFREVTDDEIERIETAIAASVDPPTEGEE